MHNAEKSGESDGAYIDRGVGNPDPLQRLWAPYRMAYITDSSAGGGEQDADAAAADEDPFTAAPKKSDEDALIVARGEHVYCLLNLFPYNAGHMMVVPYRKVADLEELGADEAAEMMAFAQEAVRTLKRASHPDGVNVGFNLGQASGGSVRDHLHMHIVPRWAGDANFMTILGGTKVLPQLLKETRALLARNWGQAC